MFPNTSYSDISRRAGRSELVLLLGMLAGCAPRASEPVAPLGPRFQADPTCPVDFASIETVVRADYAGYWDKVVGREAALAELTDTVRAALSIPRDGPSCDHLLMGWTSFFGDLHLTVVPSLSERSTAPPARGMVGVGQSGGPSLRFYDDSTVVLRLPNFAIRYAAEIDSLVRANRERLLQTPYMVIDVRSNGGGWPGSYAPLLPLLYTRPFRVDGIDTWSTPGNIEAMRSGLREGVAEDVQALIREVLPRMEANPGQFVVLEAAREVRFDTVHAMPRAVALLIGRGCASSCEQFVLEAAQSDKVTLLGTDNTLGAVDYLNVRTVDLPSGRRQLRVPIARSHRIPFYPLDGIGIAPEVHIPRDERNVTDYARLFLRSGTPAADDGIVNDE